MENLYLLEQSFYLKKKNRKNNLNMGQKTNPNLLRIEKTKAWPSIYTEKKTTESKIYSFYDYEIKKFIEKFFKKNGLTVQKCNIFYTNENYLHIFISYYLTYNLTTSITKINKNQHIKLVKFKTPIKRKIKKNILIIKNIINYVKYRQMNYNIILSKNISKINFQKVKKIFKIEKQALKIRRINLLKHFKNYFTVNKHKVIKQMRANSFFKKFFESLFLFIKNKNLNLHLTLEQTNKNLKESINKKNKTFLKTNLIQLKKYNQNDFFKDGINQAFITLTQNKNANLIAQYIAIQLKKLKRHNFFLRFIIKILSIFINKTFSNVQGIKIKVKGRFNGNRRAKSKKINIGKGVPTLTLKSNIEYAEETSFTLNGTFGVKVWVCYKNKK